MPVNNLGEIKEVELRNAWEQEPAFTHWLSQEKNLAALGEEIGLDIQLMQTEANVGDFNVDILAEEVGTGKKIIIENQLETTNHDHLGKLLTYASGHEANYVIWIFKTIREEHRQAIDWLNNNTADNVAFFAVKLELWQIGNSVPAPKFDVICRPNEWAKTIKGNKSSEEPTDLKLKQLELWTGLKDYAADKKLPIKFQTPRYQHWTNISIGSREAHIGLTINTRNPRLGCEIYIQNNKPLYQLLAQNKEKIEQAIGAPLEWREADVACRIVQYKNGFDINAQDSYPQYFDWFLDRAVTFYKVFSKEIKQLTKTL